MNRAEHLASALAAAAALVATPLVARAADRQSLATACVPTSVNAMNQSTVPANGSYIRAKPALGPNPPALNFVCNIHVPSAGPNSTWSKMRLDYADTVGGQVSATLYSKAKGGGSVVNLGQIVSVAGAGIRSATVAVPTMNFSTHYHYVLLSLQPQPATQPQLHAVGLIE